MFVWLLAGFRDRGAEWMGFSKTEMLDQVETFPLKFPTVIKKAHIIYYTVIRRPRRLFINDPTMRDLVLRPAGNWTSMC